MLPQEKFAMLRDSEYRVLYYNGRIKDAPSRFKHILRDYPAGVYLAYQGRDLIPQTINGTSELNYDLLQAWEIMMADTLVRKGYVFVEIIAPEQAGAIYPETVKMYDGKLSTYDNMIAYLSMLSKYFTFEKGVYAINVLKADGDMYKASDLTRLLERIALNGREDNTTALLTELKLRYEEFVNGDAVIFRTNVNGANTLVGTVFGHADTPHITKLFAIAPQLLTIAQKAAIISNIDAHTDLRALSDEAAALLQSVGLYTQPLTNG